MIRSRSTSFLLVCGVALAFGPGDRAPAQETLADLESFREGSLALTDERFETAATNFLQAWNILLESEAGEIERDFVAARILESLVRDERSAAALGWFQKSSFPSPSPRLLWWLAVAQQNSGSYSAAARSFGEIAASDGPLQREALLNRALSLAHANRGEPALELVRSLLPIQSPSEILRFARVAALSDDAALVLELLDAGVNRPEENSFDLLALEVWALSVETTVDEAYAVLAEHLEQSSTVEESYRLFLVLEALTQRGDLSELESDLERWLEQDERNDLEAVAFFHGILTAPSPVDRDNFLSSWLESRPGSSLNPEANIRLGRQLGTPDQILGGLDRLRFPQAAKALQSERFEEAKNEFLTMATLAKGQNRAADLFNAGIAALLANDYESYEMILRDLRKEGRLDSFEANLRLAGALKLAQEGQLEAIEMLQEFTRQYPDHPRLVEAQFALAELYLNQAPARPQTASEILDRLRNQTLTLEQSERLAYLEVWLAAISLDTPGLLAKGGAFLEDWPSSRFFPEVAMLVARRHLEEGNQEEARAAFLQIAESFPESPYAETAIFLAARSIPPGESALEAWTRIAESESSLRLEARHELGLLLLSLDRFEEARYEFELLLEEEAGPSDLRFAVLADHAFSFYAEALTEEEGTAFLEEAANRYAQFASLPGITDFWKYNAAVRRGKCLEALGNEQVALEIYQSIVSETSDFSLAVAPESDRTATDWIFRAGFSAIEILREKKNWAQAIRMAEALSEKDGPRAIEAAAMAERMRLQNWVWD